MHATAAGGHHIVFLPLVICLLLMAYPVVRLVGVFIERAISLAELLIALIVLVGLMGGLVQAWGTSWAWLFAGAFLSVCTGVPVLNRMAEKRLQKRMDSEDFRICLRVLQLDPKNPAAHSRLGDIHLAHGRLDEAIAAYEQATALAPTDDREKWKLNRAIEAKRRSVVHSAFCPRCDAENAPTATHCRKCGTVLSGVREMWGHVRSGLGLDMLKWTALASGGAMLFALVLADVPVTVIVVCGLVLVGTGMSYLYLRVLRQ
jgi:ribosomal protein L40E